MLTVGIDTGGTFTDVFVNDDDGRVATRIARWLFGSTSASTRSRRAARNA